MNDQNPYAPPSSDPVFFQEDNFFELADRLPRLSAKLFDGLILFALIFLVGVIAALLGGIDTEMKRNTSMMMVITLAGIAFISWAGVNLYLLHTNGQTMGKKALGIRIIRSDGEPASLWRLVLLRAWVPVFISWIPIVGFIFTLCDPLCIFRENHKCLHDDIAGTIVVVA